MEGQYAKLPAMQLAVANQMYMTDRVLVAKFCISYVFPCQTKLDA